MHIRFVQGVGEGVRVSVRYVLFRIIVILSMNETSLKSSYNKVPRRMKRIMLKFFAN